MSLRVFEVSINGNYISDYLYIFTKTLYILRIWVFNIGRYIGYNNIKPSSMNSPRCRLIYVLKITNNLCCSRPFPWWIMMHHKSPPYGLYTWMQLILLVFAKVLLVLYRDSNSSVSTYIAYIMCLMCWGLKCLLCRSFVTKYMSSLFFARCFFSRLLYYMDEIWYVLICEDPHKSLLT